MSEMVSKHTVSVLVDNEPGVLARVIGLISGRGYNIDSLTVAEVDAEKHISRITIVAPGTEQTVNKMISQLQRIVPVKIFIINNQYMGMVRQWQELLHDKRYSHSYTDALPDFVKLAEAYGAKGIRVQKPNELDKAINEMIEYDGPVIFDCVVEQNENVYPMIPSGKAHNEMLLGDETKKEEISDEGKVLV